MTHQVAFQTGRRGGIRTRDPLHPMQVRYQAALHAEASDYILVFKPTFQKTEDLLKLNTVQIIKLHFDKLVGVAGFELATPCTPCKCATRLRYTPKP